MKTSQSASPAAGGRDDNAAPTTPSMLSHYAAYMRARARATPDIRMNGNQAEIRLDLGDTRLVAIFGCRKGKWFLRSIQIRRGRKTATFNRGELTRAIATLLGQQPMRPTSQAAGATSGPRTNTRLRERRTVVIRT
jgi:hypothetical protein